MIEYKVVIKEGEQGVEFYGRKIPIKVGDPAPTDAEKEISDILGEAMNWVAEKVSERIGEPPIMSKPAVSYKEKEGK